MQTRKTENPELDVRAMRKPDKHPAIFAAYQALDPDRSFILVNNHDPVHLREEFEIEHAGGYGWEYLQSGPREWRIRITKLTTTPLPRILTDTSDYDTRVGAGVEWALPVGDRDLDSNIIRIRPGGEITTHVGAEVDVLVHVLDGTGQLITERGPLDLRAGFVVWLPRRSRRGFVAGPDGLRYLTVHRHRQALVLDAPRHSVAVSPPSDAQGGQPNASRAASRGGGPRPGRSDEPWQDGAR